jgi:hypothetical protein
MWWALAVFQATDNGLLRLCPFGEFGLSKAALHTQTPHGRSEGAPRSSIILVRHTLSHEPPAWIVIKES